jgi:hypothetical protein
MHPHGREDRRGRMDPSGEKDRDMSPHRLRQSAKRVHRSASRAGPCALIDARIGRRAAPIHNEGLSPRGHRTPHRREGVSPIGPKGHRFARVGLGIRREGLPLPLGERVENACESSQDGDERPPPAQSDIVTSTSSCQGGPTWSNSGLPSRLGGQQVLPEPSCPLPTALASALVHASRRRQRVKA